MGGEKRKDPMIDEDNNEHCFGYLTYWQSRSIIPLILSNRLTWTERIIRDSDIYYLPAATTILYVARLRVIHVKSDASLVSPSDICCCCCGSEKPLLLIAEPNQTKPNGWRLWLQVCACDVSRPAWHRSVA